MKGLEDLLTKLADEIDVPAAPDAWPAVEARLDARARRTWWTTFRVRRRYAIALAVILAAVAAAVAIPPARTALERLFGLGGIHVKRVATLPAAGPRRPLRLGELVSLGEARRRAPFARAPHVAPDPRVFFEQGGNAAAPPGGRVSFLVGTLAKPKLLVTEFRGSNTRRYADKIVGPGTTVERVSVGGDPGVWISGRPHVFYYSDLRGAVNAETLRLAANTLIWEHGGVTFRIEGRIAKADALAIAEAME
jgi:hypothetical protein